jgi:hypothetical protein
MQGVHSLKEVITIRAIEMACEHAAPLETEGRNRMGTGRFGQVSQGALCARSQPDLHV